jgi:hypothetical protein
MLDMTSETQIGNENDLVDPYSLAQPDGNRSCQGPKSQRRKARMDKVRSW